MKSNVYYPISTKKQKPKQCPCGSNYPLQAHHPDYNFPKEVMWMCEACHSAIHKNRYDKKSVIRSDKNNYIFEKIKEKNMTMIGLAIATKVSYSTIQSWRKGLCSPSPENMKKLKQVVEAQ